MLTGEKTEADYQIEKAKIAIASGGITGLGPGKSIQKNFLPQSSSDFIYAVIVEEFGFSGGSIYSNDSLYMVIAISIRYCSAIKLTICFWYHY